MSSYGVPAVSHGVYLNPIGHVGCWRVDVRVIAEAATKVVTAGSTSK
jgi:hypothetical protein